MRWGGGGGGVVALSCNLGNEALPCCSLVYFDSHLTE